MYGGPLHDEPLPLVHFIVAAVLRPATQKDAKSILRSI